MAILNRTEQILINQISSRREIYGSWIKKAKNSLDVAEKLTV